MERKWAQLTFLQDTWEHGRFKEPGGRGDALLGPDKAGRAPLPRPIRQIGAGRVCSPRPSKLHRFV